MYKSITFLIALTAICLDCEAKIFTRCGLVDELRRQGFREELMRDWVCLIEAESKRDTAVIGPVNHNGSRDWGLFQINDKYWCSITDTAGKDCDVRCRDLITDDVTSASNCAKMIYKRHHFNAWYGWIKKCKGQPLPDISDC